MARGFIEGGVGGNQSWARPVPVIGDATSARTRREDPAGWAMGESVVEALESVVGARRDIRRFRPDPVPTELLEAARIAGAGDWRIFFRVILPLGLPAIASLAIFQFLWTWNDMLVALIFTNSESQPLTVAIQSQLRQYGANLDVLSTGAFVSMIVPLIVFFAFQRYFVQALLAGSQK